ncbi:MAG: TIGR02757 family protein [Balneolales bacterium]|nr:TIGR02757 family protein [Balneolales bacterium]
MLKPKLKVLSKKKLLDRKSWLDEIIEEVEVPEYIPSDPVSFMHAFDSKEDQLLAGFFAALMAWGRRDIVLAKVTDLLQRMEYQPEHFIRNFTEESAQNLIGFKHRTFTSTDVYWLIRCLQQALRRFGHFEAFWSHCYRSASDQNLHLMDVFHDEFFALQPETPQRTRKHIASKKKKSSCKRLLLYLRWSVRGNSPVDLGLMQFMPTSELMIPLDVHVARQARKLGLLSRHQNDWGAVQELNDRLLLLDPEDPSKYDYALFGIGVLNKELPPEFIVNTKVE